MPLVLIVTFSASCVHFILRSFRVHFYVRQPAIPSSESAGAREHLFISRAGGRGFERAGSHSKMAGVAREVSIVGSGMGRPRRHTVFAEASPSNGRRPVTPVWTPPAPRAYLALVHSHQCRYFSSPVPCLFYQLQRWRPSRPASVSIISSYRNSCLFSIVLQL